LRRALARTGRHRVVDLGSGGGGPWIGLREALGADVDPPVEVVLTDLHPNLPAFGRAHPLSVGRIGYHEAPVDAARVPPGLAGFRTLFSAFHHFRPEESALVLRDAVARGQPIGVFQATQRRLPVLLGMLITPWLVLLTTPLIRPFRWFRLFWTYLVPLLPLVVLFDGIVSCLRTYTPAELRRLADQVAGSKYEWEIGEEPIARSLAALTYLIGYPSSDPPGQGSCPTT
jgi:hypothetical protein